MARSATLGDEPHTWTLAFVDPAREAAFIDDYAREIRGFYRIALVAVLALWSASVGFDLQADAADRTPLFAIRFGAVTPVLVAALAVGFLPWPWFRRLWPLAATVAYAAVQAGVIGLVIYAPGEMSQLVVGGFLLTVLIGAAMDLARAVRIVGIASVGAVGMGVALARSPSVGTRALWIDLLWIAVAAALGDQAVERLADLSSGVRAGFSPRWRGSDQSGTRGWFLEGAARQAQALVT